MLNFYTLTFKSSCFVKVIMTMLVMMIVAHVMFFESFARNNIFTEDFSARQYLKLKKMGNQIKVVAIGTSHIQHGVIIDSRSFFNYGRMFTWYPQVALAKVKHAFYSSKNLTALILEVDPLCLFKYDHNRHKQMPGNHAYLLSHILNKHEIDNSNDLVFVSLMEDVAPAIHKKYFEYVLKKNIEKRKMAKKTTGRHAITTAWMKLTDSEKKEKAMKRAKGQLLSFPRIIDNETDHYYREAITLATKRNVHVYLLITPQTKEYMASIHPTNNRLLESYVNKLSVFNNVTVLDYRKLFEHQEYMFGDQDHLNVRGAKELGKRVFDQMSEALLKKER